MDDDEGVRAALHEARECGDISVIEYLRELRKLRPRGDAATAGDSSTFAPAAAQSASAAASAESAAAAYRRSDASSSSSMVGERSDGYLMHFEHLLSSHEVLMKCLTPIVS